MGNTFLAHWIPNDIIKATAWTLLHSAWIGLLFAAVAGLVVTLAKRSPARLRYHLLCSILVSFVLVMLYTFLRELRISSIASSETATAGAIAAIVQSSGITRQLISWLNQQSGIIFLIWLIFFAIKSARLTGGIFYIHKIRTRNIKAVPEKWQEKLNEFCTKITISKPVTLLQSELVSVPVAIGWLKPVILLPVGVIFQLSPEQVESILLHELAHIRRQDYLVNILQGIVEAVFFFNPALLWLSSLIRQEREACCDDVVLAHISRKSDYLEALLALGGHTGKINLAMTLAAGSSQLKHRLKRMICLENQKLSVREVFSLLLGLVFITAFTLMPEAQAATVNKKASVTTGDYLRAADYNSVQQPKKQATTRAKHKKLNAREVNSIKMFGHEMAVNYQDMMTQIDQGMGQSNPLGKKQQHNLADTASAGQPGLKNHQQAMGADSVAAGKRLKYQKDIPPIKEKAGSTTAGPTKRGD
jgi:bla regulator protein BlaR1